MQNLNTKLKNPRKTIHGNFIRKSHSRIQEKRSESEDFTHGKILKALSKALSIEKANLEDVNKKIDQYNQRNQDLPKLLVDQTQKKNKLMKILTQMSEISGED